MNGMEKQSSRAYQEGKEAIRISDQIRAIFEGLPKAAISNEVASSRGGDIAMKENAHQMMKNELYKIQFSREDLHEMVLEESVKKTIRGSIMTEMFQMFVKGAEEICAEREALSNEFFHTL